MTLTERIERARRRREDELLLMLLLVSEDARRDTVIAVRHGFSVQTVMQNTFNRAVPIIVGSMVDAHLDAARRFSHISGEDIVPQDTAIIATMYEQHARDAAQAMSQRLYDAITAARDEQAGISTRPITDEIAEPLTDKAMVRKAFDEAGYSRTSAESLDLGAERAIVFASNIGMIAAGSLSGLVTGLKHVSIVDARTTVICRRRDGLKLPIDDPYWRFNIPPLHHYCRSIIEPIIGSFEPSETYPNIPPKPGFGEMPPDFFEEIRRPT